MCGIAGRFNFLSGAPVDPGTIRAMCDLIAHRGPDGEGTYVDGAIGLGHRRLAIIDLSPAGRQPMTDETGTLWITYNGEIYNFPELRRDLEARGFRFRSRTDTEVILAAYRAFGPDCVSRLRGMFAFAVWDARERSLFIARDRAGKKPLFYTVDGDGIAFASEPKAFLADPAFKPQPNLTAISHYLTYQYVPSPHSAFAGVAKLPPAHWLLVRDGKVETRRYWRLRYRPKRRLTEDAAIDELLARLREAVRIRLMSDVPLGAFLSGGIDSSLVVALMTELGAAPVRTFSIGFEEAQYDERHYARLVAERFGTDHHEFVVRPDAAAIFDQLVWHYGEPFADSSAIPTYYLAELTRRHVTVALNGDAGDENFAGYERYLAHVLATHSTRVPGVVRRGVAGLASAALAWAPPRSTLARARRFAEALADSPERRYARWMSHFDGTVKRELCTEEFRRASGDVDSEALVVDAYRASDGPDLVDATLDVDVRTYLPDDLLVKVDIATMAHGLEARSPFVDHEVMEFCASLPSSLKLHGRIKKYLLKQAAAKYLPAAIIERPKMGFGVPVDHWFRRELKDLARDTLLGPSASDRGYFRMDFVRRILDEHAAGTRHWHYQLWNLLALELWHRLFIDGAGRAREGAWRRRTDAS
jgi:asparagine synthase (glutamine-hydrolysing)